ncbi:MAG: cation transporter [Coriobacteriia bacterium]|nr:cation transporter [Coriobacteriia bacterium]MBN2847501.1 cation transporter [Coriobacteriia bacterium]
MADPAPETHRFDLAAVLPGPQHCVACAERICAGVRGLEGVLTARCDSEAGELEVTFDPSVVSFEELNLVIERRALEEADAFGHAVYRLEGLD